jgi:hypothetical protein
MIIYNQPIAENGFHTITKRPRMSPPEDKMPSQPYKDRLPDALVRDEAILIGEYVDILSTTRVSFRCRCGTIRNKDVRGICKKGAFCEPCMETLRLARIKKTNLERYNVEHPIQNSIIKDKIGNTMLERHGVKHALQSKTFKTKSEDTCMKNHGVKNPFESDKIKDKIKETNNERYGADYGVESDIVKDKIKKTNLEKYGSTCSLLNQVVMDKIKATNLERYKVEYPFQNITVQDKFKQTNRERYQVDYPAQNQEVAERTQKNAKKYKEYTMPSGTIRKVQGYEPFALRDLLEIYSEEQIKSDRKDVPHVQYEMNGKKKYYFPDIFVPHEKKIIEVKSPFTLKLKPEQIQLKKKACEEQGFCYEIWCFDARGNRVVLPYISQSITMPTTD